MSIHLHTYFIHRQWNFFKTVLCFLMAAGAVSSFSSKALAFTNTKTAIFDPSFRTITLSLNDDFMAAPVLRMDANDILTVTFDQISGDRSYLRYRLLHCNADWQPSLLLESEYLDAINEATIDDYAFSSNTFIHFVNYRLTIPNEEVPLPKVSGNYLLQVYGEDDPDEVLLQVRFYVSENSVPLYASVSGRTDLGLNTEWQQLSVVAPLPEMSVADPYSEFMLSITQNNRPDTQRILRAPLRMEGEILIYEHLPQLIFPAGNEYRRFETVRNNYPGMGVDSTRFIAPMYQAYLKENSSRACTQYVFDKTQYGRFKIDEYNSTDPDLGADYIMTHFTLDFPEVIDGDIYVEGDLALRDYTDFNRMTYDRSQGLHTLSVPLKQGSYNYQYVILPKDYQKNSDDGAKVISPGVPASSLQTEGNHFETVNEYNLFLYHHAPGARADRLLGTRTAYNLP